MLHSGHHPSLLSLPIHPFEFPQYFSIPFSFAHPSEYDLYVSALPNFITLLSDFPLPEILQSAIPRPLLSKYLKKLCHSNEAFEFHDASPITDVYYAQLASWMASLQSALAGTSVSALLDAMRSLECGLNRFVALTGEEQSRLTELVKELCALFYAVKGTATATALSEACKEESEFVPAMISLVASLLSLYSLNQDMTQLFEGEVWNILAQCSASFVDFPFLCLGLEACDE